MSGGSTQTINKTNSLSSLVLKENSNQPWFVEKVGLDMVNEGGAFSSYTNMFVKNSVYPGSSVLEIMNQGIDSGSIFVIKPVNSEIPMVRSDFVKIDDLATYGCNAAYSNG